MLQTFFPPSFTSSYLRVEFCLGVSWSCHIHLHFIRFIILLVSCSCFMSFISFLFYFYSFSLRISKTTNIEKLHGFSFILRRISDTTWHKNTSLFRLHPFVKVLFFNSTAFFPLYLIGVTSSVCFFFLLNESDVLCRPLTFTRWHYRLPFRIFRKRIVSSKCIPDSQFAIFLGCQQVVHR